MTSKIEVIIPAYNAAEYIVETLESVRMQTLMPEVITVVDDSSTDDTAALVSAYATQHASSGISIQILSNTGPRGPSSARNTALKRNETEWVAFLDADDIMKPRQLSVLANMLHTQASAVLSFVDSQLFNAGGVLIPSLFVHSGLSNVHSIKLTEEISTLGDDTFLQLTKTGIFGTSACLMRRAAVKDVGYFDESMMYCEDTDLFLRMSQVGTFVFSKKILSLKRVHGTNLTHPKNAVFFGRGTVYLLAKALDLLPNSFSNHPCLTGDQRRVLESQLSIAIQGYLYHASLGGTARYRDAMSLCNQIGFGLASINPKHLARMAKTYMFGA